jgi:hypothetical protein
MQGLHESSYKFISTRNVNGLNSLAVPGFHTSRRLTPSRIARFSSFCRVMLLVMPPAKPDDIKRAVIVLVMRLDLSVFATFDRARSLFDQPALQRRSHNLVPEQLQRMSGVPPRLRREAVVKCLGACNVTVGGCNVTLIIFNQNEPPE